MKRILIIGCVIVLIFVLAGCLNTDPVVYPFLQDRANVAKVEICAYDDVTNTRELLVELSENDISSLWDDIAKLVCYNLYAIPPLDMYGDFVIWITYCDGTQEILGECQVGWISPDGKEQIVPYWFLTTEFNKLIDKYSTGK